MTHPVPSLSLPLEAEALLAHARASGADDAALVSLDHPDLAPELPDVRAALPSARCLLSVVVRTSRAPIRAPPRSLAHTEFHRASARADDVGDALTRALEERGVAAIAASGGFPMEKDRFPSRGWVVSHKTVAVAAGLGRTGLQRNVIHPRFGSFILLGTVIIGQEVSASPRALDVNPCKDCRLCAAACPVGAIEPGGRFDAAACLTHNDREFMTGFNDLVGTVAESRDRGGFRARVGQAESASGW